MSIKHLTEQLLAARAGDLASNSGIAPCDRAEAYAVQDATIARLGDVGGWKVGARGPDVEPACAPCPARGILPSGAELVGPAWRLRGVEVEVGLRLRCDLRPGGRMLPAKDLMSAIAAIVPVVEIVETRLADWEHRGPLAQLADLQNHGALLYGEPEDFRPEMLDLSDVEATLAFDDKLVAQTRGGNPARDIWRLLGWLAQHCEARGRPLRAGDLITTGSCTGMLFAKPGTKLDASLRGIGTVTCQF